MSFLNHKEVHIFKFLMEFLRSEKLKIELRVVGGWVRDKILGRESDDIDIAISDMNCLDFVQKFSVFYEKHKNKNKKNGFEVIKENKEALKNVMAIRIKIFDTKVDFMNLRKEKYDETSRIPFDVQLARPDLDSYRRDLTINALFYNLNNHHIEDFTQLGLVDLRHRLLRCPLDAYTSLSEDPIRIFRAAKFAARFDFEIHKDILHAANLPFIQELLRVKVNRNRLAAEFHSLLSENNPGKALILLCDLGCYSSCFNLSYLVDSTLTNHSVNPKNSISNKLNKWMYRTNTYVLSNEFLLISGKDVRLLLRNILDLLECVSQNELTSFFFSSEEKTILFLAAWVYPFRGMKMYDTSSRRGYASNVLLREAFNVLPEQSKLASKILEATQICQSYFQTNSSHNFSDLLYQCGLYWRVSLFLAFSIKFSKEEKNLLSENLKKAEAVAQKIESSINVSNYFTCLAMFT